MYRVRDIVDNKWVKDDIYLSPYPHSDLYILEKNIFGIKKLKLAPSDRYVCQRSIDLCDKNNVLIYEGDYVKAEIEDNEYVVGLVIYAEELSSYIILCDDLGRYYTLGTEVYKYIEVIGNVYDNKKESE